VERLRASKPMQQWHDQSLQYSILAIDQSTCHSRFVILEEPRLETHRCPGGLSTKRRGGDLDNRIVPNPPSLSSFVTGSNERTISFNCNVDGSGHRVSIPAMGSEKDSSLMNEALKR